VSWSDLTDWWLDEIDGDPAYDAVVTPMLIDVLEPESGRTYLDIGCGEGRIMRALADHGSRAIGVELNLGLADRAAETGSVVNGLLPNLGFLRDDAVDGVVCVLVVEHIEDHRYLLTELARVVAPGGVFALVMNHPFWTAPGSTPITDADFEVLWRPGSYFEPGSSLERAGEQQIVFHHRSTGDLLEAAASAGWSLERLVEAPHHEFPDQAGIPRLLACRWRLLP
jgi:SAM-dependent methyltransferase